METKHVARVDLSPERTWPRVATLVVKYRAYPYDEFVVFMLPDGSVQAYRSTSNEWKVAELPVGHPLVGASAVEILDALFEQVDANCKDRLTRVEPS